jgi:hypothetical protein
MTLRDFQPIYGIGNGGGQELHAVGSVKVFCADHRLIYDDTGHFDKVAALNREKQTMVR